MISDEVAATFDRHESRVRSYCRDFPLLISRASGHLLWDRNGVRYVDLLCGAGALNYGHNHPEIVAAVTRYLAGGGPVQSLDLHTEAKLEFLHRFASEILVPRGLGDYVMQFPGPAGTLAVEAALKLARKVTGRSSVVAFSGGFHGASLGSLAASSSATLRRVAGVGLGDVTVVPYENQVAGVDSLRLLDHLLTPGGGIDPPAAVLLETVQGEGGLQAASPQWLSQLASMARRAGALLVVDDVQAGCGRTGTFLSIETTPGLTPDLLCLSKSLSGMGLPMAMLLIRRELDAWSPGEHNGTFRGHNLAFVGACAALDLWSRSTDFVDHVGLLSAAMRDDLAELSDTVNAVAGRPVAQLVGRGAMSGLRLAEPGLAERLSRELFTAGYIAETSGQGAVLKLFPPLTMRLEEWRAAVSAIADTLLRLVGGRMERRVA